MAAKRPEPFGVVLTTVRAQLRQAAYAPGTRLVAMELAAALQVSHTPVREALARLAGEGLLEDRRGEGYFVWRDGAAELIGLLRLQEAHLGLALRRLGVSAASGSATAALRSALQDDPVFGAVRLVERLFLQMALDAGGVLGHAQRRLGERLSPLRQGEPALFGDLDGEAAVLAEAADQVDIPRLRVAIQRFHARRRARVDQLVGRRNAGAAIAPL